MRSADAGDYTVVVTSALGSATSNKATLTIGTPSAGTPPATSGSGGGAIDEWFVAGLIGLGLLLRPRRR